MRFLKIFILLSLFFIACSKEKHPAASVSEEIQEIVKNRTIFRVIAAYTYSDYFTLAYEPGSTHGLQYSFTENFVTIENVSWNLNQLISYRLHDLNGKLIMGMLFR